MTMNLIKLDDMYKKYPFIYKVSGEYYYIGAGICKACTDADAINYYNDYLNAMLAIGREELSSHNIERRDSRVENLIYYFRKVILCSEINIDKNDQSTYRRDIEVLIDLLSEEQKDSLLMQLVDYVNVFYYYNRDLKQIQ